MGTLHVVRAGSGQPLVLLHGIGGSWRHWLPVLDLLAAEREVLAVDMPGFGDSPPLPDSVTPDPRALASAVAEAMTDHGLSDAHIAGNSLGGLVALELAAAGRARSVTALSPAGAASVPEWIRAGVILRTLRTAARAAAPFAPRLSGNRAIRAISFASAVSRPADLGREHALAMSHDYARATAFEDTLGALQRDQTVERFAGLECPVVIAWGDKDRILLPVQGRRFKHAIPSARLIRLRGLGHVPMSDDPKMVAGVILDASAR